MTRKDLVNDMCSRYLIQMLYVESYAYLNKKFEPDILKKKLRQMGYNISESIYKYYKPSSNTISGIVKDIYNISTGIKNVKINKNFTETEKEFTISVKKCPLCTYELREAKVFYCTQIMAIIERYLNLSIQDNRIKRPVKQIIGKVLKSVSSGDDACEYHYKIIEE
ncbi:MAG: hypothetical protein ACTSPY_01930 [Candidatus Helarchaeota archaeon]